MVVLTSLVGAIDGEMSLQSQFPEINPRQYPTTGDTPLIRGACSGDSCLGCRVASAQVLLLVAFAICLVPRLLLQFEF